METTLFNKNGKPVAYLGENGATVYMWDGRAVAYLHDGKVYGWNGKQLGWFVNGTIFDIYGLRCGFIKKKSPLETELEPVKPVKQVTPKKSERQPSVTKPSMCYGYSGKSLEELLEEGGIR
jgi:hypothetical protein